MFYGSLLHSTVSCFATNETPPSTLSPYMDPSTAPTPPLSALRLRWIAYLHGHVTPRGKGARLCAWLTLVQPPPSQCHYFRSATRVSLETFGSVACHVHQSEELVGSVQVRTQSTLCASDRRRTSDWIWLSLQFVRIFQLLFYCVF